MSQMGRQMASLFCGEVLGIPPVPRDLGLGSTNLFHNSGRIQVSVVSLRAVLHNCIQLKQSALPALPALSVSSNLARDDSPQRINTSQYFLKLNNLI